MLLTAEERNHYLDLGLRKPWAPKVKARNRWII